MKNKNEKRIGKKILLSLVLALTFVLAGNSNFLLFENYQVAANSSLPRILCEDGMLGCGKSSTATSEIDEHWLFTTGVPNWVEWAILFSAGFAIVAIMIGGGMFVLAFGNDEMHTRAKTTILWAIAGLLLAMFALAIVQIVERISFPGT